MQLVSVPGDMIEMHPERELRSGGWFPMQTATQYQKFAEDCERLASKAKSKEHREILLEMSEVWRKLAEEAENKAGSA